MTGHIHRWVPDDELQDVCASCGRLRSELRPAANAATSAALVGRAGGARRNSAMEEGLLHELEVERALFREERHAAVRAALEGLRAEVDGIGPYAQEDRTWVPRARVLAIIDARLEVLP